MDTNTNKTSNHINFFLANIRNGNTQACGQCERKINKKKERTFQYRQEIGTKGKKYASERNEDVSKLIFFFNIALKKRSKE